VLRYRGYNATFRSRSEYEYGDVQREHRNKYCAAFDWKLDWQQHPGKPTVPEFRRRCVWRFAEPECCADFREQYSGGGDAAAGCVEHDQHAARVLWECAEPDQFERKLSEPGQSESEFAGKFVGGCGPGQSGFGSGASADREPVGAGGDRADAEFAVF